MAKYFEDNKISKKCPDFSDLEDYASGDIDSEEYKRSINEHLNGCYHCFRLVEACKKERPEFFNEDESKNVVVPEEIKRMAVFEDPGIIEYGQIWSTLTEDGQLGSRYVVVTLVTNDHDESSIPDVQIVPLSDKVNSQIDLDVIISANKNPFGSEFMAQTWCLQNVFITQLDRYFGRLDEKTRNQLEYVRRCALKFKSVEKPEGVIVGEPIKSEDDPRALYMKETLKETEYLRIPVLRGVIEVYATDTVAASAISEASLFPILIKTARNYASESWDTFKTEAQNVAGNMWMNISMAGGPFNFGIAAAAGRSGNKEKAEDVKQELFASEEQEFVFDVRFFMRKGETAPYVLIRARKKTGNYTDNPPIHLIQLWKDGKGGAKEVKEPDVELGGGLVFAEFPLEEAERNKNTSADRKDEYTFNDFRKGHCIFVIAPFTTD